MKRAKLNRKTSRKVFKRHAGTKRINATAHVSRGGIRF